MKNNIEIQDSFFGRCSLTQEAFHGQYEDSAKIGKQETFYGRMEKVEKYLNQSPVDLKRRYAYFNAGDQTTVSKFNDVVQ